mmetsp:Transcript_17227/g.26610  ORF Transcript_17227/g.26610 Transcript_17227/m.26610 type:complete len:103 (+) Transcript_17227:317-625(+)
MWCEAPNIQQSHFHFRWAPVSRQVNFDRLSHNMLQVVNHFEGHTEISRKHELFKNVKHHLERQQMAHLLSTMNDPTLNPMGSPLLFSMLPLQFNIKVDVPTP